MRNYKFKIKSVKTMDKELCKFMKVCKDCGQLKLVNKFGKRKQMKDGYENSCKKCRYEKGKQRHKHICKYCGKEFKSINKVQQFCSTECRSNWRSENVIGENHPSYNRVTVLCDCCGKEIIIIKSKIKQKHHFCNRECQAKWQSENFKGENNPFFGKEGLRGENNPNWQGGGIKVYCNYCGKELLVRKSDIRRAKHHFCSQECHGKWMSENQIGENCPAWNPNKTQEERELCRDTSEGKAWRQQVFERDNYTCQLSGQIGGKLEAHHLYSYNKYKDLRCDVDNGITLSKELHRLFHKLYGKKHNTKEQFEEFRIRYNNGEFKEVA